MNTVNELVLKGWTLQCWNDRYSRGVWAVVAPNYFQTHDVQDVLDGSDAESLNLGAYIQEHKAFLPIANGVNLQGALIALENKLLHLVKQEDWMPRVFDAFERIRETDWNINTPSEDEE